MTAPPPLHLGPGTLYWNAVPIARAERLQVFTEEVGQLGAAATKVTLVFTRLEYTLENLRLARQRAGQHVFYRKRRVRSMKRK